MGAMTISTSHSLEEVRSRTAPRRRVLAIALLAWLLAGCDPMASSPSGPVAPPTRVPSPAPPSSAPAPHGGLSLHRGLDLGNALDAPNEGDWGVTLAAPDFAAAKDAGFDHVGLPVRFDAHTAVSPPYRIDPAFVRRVDWAVDQALERGLAIVISFHNDDALTSSPDAERPRFVSIWQQVAEHMRSRPPAVVFELYSEPSGALTAPRWNDVVAETMAAVRASNPTRPVILDGTFWGSAKNLRDTLRLPAGDRNVIGGFRMFQPILFTHQGAPYMPEEYDTRGVVFPGPPTAPIEPGPGAKTKAWVRDWFARYDSEPAERNPSGPSAIANELDCAKDFGDRTGLAVYMGGFGAIDVADAASRRAWTRMTRKEAERRGFAWAYWDDGNRFRIYDRKTGAWDEGLKAALFE